MKKIVVKIPDHHGGKYFGVDVLNTQIVCDQKHTPDVEQYTAIPDQEIPPKLLRYISFC